MLWDSTSREPMVTKQMSVVSRVGYMHSEHEIHYLLSASDNKMYCTAYKKGPSSEKSDAFLFKL